MTKVWYFKYNLQKGMLFFLGLMIFGLTACNKEDTPPEQEVFLNDEEVSALLQGSLALASQGLAKEMEDGAGLANQYTVKTLNGPCGESFDTTLNYNLELSWITAAYSTSWDWAVNCTGEVPTSLSYNRSMSGNYETQRLRSNDEAGSSWVIEGFVLSPDYLFSGSYSRQGSQESLVRDRNFSSNIALTVPEIRVDKASRRISGGSAGLVFAGENTNGQSFSLEGSIDFLGNGLANVTVNGNTYEIELY